MFAKIEKDPFCFRRFSKKHLTLFITLHKKRPGMFK